MARLHRIDPAASPGIRRARSRGRFRYVAPDGGSVSAATRRRIAELAIPPAWARVWISPDPDSHIQAMGTDAAGRRQYLYHDGWRARRDLEKFDRALRLAESLPAARARVTRALRADDEPLRTLAVAVRLLDQTGLRIGSPRYLRTYGSRGLVTLRWGNVSLSGDEITLTFSGKLGMRQRLTFTDEDLAAWIAGQPSQPARASVLRYRAGGRFHDLSPAAVNAFICDCTGDRFSAKDFRTLRGTGIAAVALAERAADEDAAARELAAIDAAAAALGNTRAVARASYVDARLLRAARRGRFIDRGVSVESALLRLLRP